MYWWELDQYGTHLNYVFSETVWLLDLEEDGFFVVGLEAWLGCYR
jgi:hypothetical protein